jgi:hypothetical protein
MQEYATRFQLSSSTCASLREAWQRHPRELFSSIRLIQAENPPSPFFLTRKRPSLFLIAIRTQSLFFIAADPRCGAATAPQQDRAFGDLGQALETRKSRSGTSLF